MDVEEKTHAKRSPSSAARWTRCPASVPMEANRPDNSNEHARWGTAAHTLAELCLEPYTKGAAPFDAEGYVGRVFQVEGHDITVDMEMADAVNTYVSYVQTYADPLQGDTLLIEQQVQIGTFTGEQGATGTSDVIGIIEQNKTLLVIDLKGGRGVRVDADNNEQELLYALGALAEHELFYEFEEALLVIVQPRLNHVSEHRIDIATLRAKGEWFQIKGRAVDDAETSAFPDKLPSNTFFAPGEKQCRFCKAKAVCPALQQEVADTVMSTGPSASIDFDDLDASVVPTTADEVAEQANVYGLAQPDEFATNLGSMMSKVDLIEGWCKAVRAETERVLLDGQEVPGWKLVEGKRGNRAWSNPATAEAELKRVARLKVDEMYEKSVISPTKAEKLLKEKPKVWAKIAPLIADQREGKPSVAPAEDKRPAWSRPEPDFDVLDEQPVDEIDPFS